MKLPALCPQWTALAVLSAMPVVASPPLGGAGLQWSELGFEARKLFLSTTSLVTAELLAPEAAASELKANPVEDRPAPAAPRGALALTLTTDLLGRRSTTRLLIDPHDGRALRREALDTGKRWRQKRTHYEARGIWTERREPADRRESERPPDRWSTISHEQLDLDPEGPAITDAAALFYLAAVAPLQRAGDRHDTTVFSRRRTVAVELVVAGTELIGVDYVETSPEGSRTVKTEVEALVVSVRAAEDADEAVQLLGLEGNIELLLEPTARFPLEVRGKVRIAGDVRVRLTSVRLR